MGQQIGSYTGDYLQHTNEQLMQRLRSRRLSHQEEEHIARVILWRLDGDKRGWIPRNNGSDDFVKEVVLGFLRTQQTPIGGKALSRELRVKHGITSTRVDRAISHLVGEHRVDFTDDRKFKIVGR